MVNLKYGSVFKRTITVRTPIFGQVNLLGLPSGDLYMVKAEKLLDLLCLFKGHMICITLMNG
nr:MAG TPA: hypothetical protein [Caudoviricetes sp.]